MRLMELGCWRLGPSVTITESHSVSSGWVRAAENALQLYNRLGTDSHSENIVGSIQDSPLGSSVLHVGDSSSNASNVSPLKTLMT
jgi:hypothetical protein